MKPNAKQQQAIEYLEGPLLVLAGPGTGKTQLLSSRVAHILEATDTAPENILCLTYTENAALNMRNRLASIVGAAAHQLNIHTYHAFGVTILQQYQQYNPEFDRPLNEAIDEVMQFKIINQIIQKLPASDILKPHAEQITNLKDIVATIGEAKAACLSPDDLAQIAQFNDRETLKINEALAPIFDNLKPRMKLDVALDMVYQPLLTELMKFTSDEPILGQIEREANILARDLNTAITDAQNRDKPSIRPLSDWVRKNFEVGPDGKKRLKNIVAGKKLLSLANIMDKYQEHLNKNGLYDYADMIQMAIDFLKKDQGFRLTMSERYQSIMLDEFQDTNPSQFALVQLLTDYEMPQVMAVGDDDQAICEFQGANSSNLLDFQNHYDAKIITLTENYRSTQDILDFSRKIADPLTDSFAKKHNIDKQLVAQSENSSSKHCDEPTVVFTNASLESEEVTSSEDLKTKRCKNNDGVRSSFEEPLALCAKQIARHEFVSTDSEYAWVAEQIKQLIDQGVPQSEIAIIAPKHKLLLPILPYLDRHKNINVTYEKNDDIFADPRISELLKLARFVHELANEKNPSYLWLEILSFPFWGISPKAALETTQGKKAHKKLKFFLTSADPIINKTTDLLAELQQISRDTPLELILDYLIGVIDTPSGQRSPFLNYYKKRQDFSTFKLYDHLSVLLTAVRNHTQKNDEPATLKDLMLYLDDCQAGEFKLYSTSPYCLDENSVQLLSVHKAKGLEFKYVFMLAVDNRSWGKSQGNNNTFVLPKNLTQIRHTGQTDDEHLRLLFVAITRAKTHLIMTNSKSDFAGKVQSHLSYLAETETESPYLPADSQAIVEHKPDPDTLALTENLQTHWLAAYHQAEPDLRSILIKRMENYKLTATDLTTFIDIRYGGPMTFYERKVLRAPSEPKSIQLVIGDAVHATFENVTKKHISDEEALQTLTEKIQKEPLTKPDREIALHQGTADLKASLAKFGDLLRSEHAVSELDFYSDHLQIDDMQLTGKIDHLQIDKTNKTIEIYDFKTGNHHVPGQKAGWKADPTLYKYTLQLEFYKLLLKTSPQYRNYNITKGHILFVKPDDDGLVHDEVYEFTDQSAADFLELAKTAYKQMTSLNFLDDPELTIYPDQSRTKKDIFNFVAKLLGE